MTGNLSQQELLKYAIENGIIDPAYLQEQIEMQKKKELLDKHPYEIWEGKNGSWYTYLPDEKKGRALKKRKTEAGIKDAIAEYYKSLEDDPSFEQAYRMWIKSKLEFGEIRRQTYDRYDTDFTRFFGASDFKNKRVRLITDEDLEEFIKISIKEKKLSNKAYAGLRLLLVGIFKYSKKRKWTTISITNFMGDLELSRNSFSKKVVTDEESVFTDEEVEKIIAFIIDRPSIINFGILLGFQTGLRVGELAVLTPQDIDGRIMTVSKTEIRYRGDDGKYVFEVQEFAKTDAGNRKVLLSKAALKTLEWIHRCNPAGKYLFEQSGKRIKEKAFSVKLSKICEQLDMPKRTMHKARKTYATKLVNAKVDERLIILQVGHTDISCTKRFYYYNNKSISEALDQIEKASGY